MMMKQAPKPHFRDEDAVSSALIGLVRDSSTRLRLLKPFPAIRVVLRSDVSPSEGFDKVSLVSGGGSGHEPGQCGYVGRGMLTAAVCGDVFASPSAEAVYRAIKATAGPKGCLLIVMNYTGDRLNFGLAAERAKAEGVKVDMIVVGEDVSLARKKTGRRGLAGTVMVHKICGAMAERGDSLEEIVRIGQACADAMGTVGASLTTCNIPGQPPDDRIAPGELELGLGIHGEPGREKRPAGTSREIAALLCDEVARPGRNEYFEASADEDVVLMVNNLGATTPIEIGALARHCCDHCQSDLGLRVRRLLVGPFKTSLDMVGVSVSLMRARAGGADLLPLLDACTDAPAWPRGATEEPPRADDDGGIFRDEGAAAAVGEPGALSTASPMGDAERELARRAVLSACAEVSCEECRDLCDALDRRTGDGDCGTTLARGAEAIAKDVSEGRFDFSSWPAAAACLARSVQVHMGGTSGAIYNILFTAAGTSLAEAEDGRPTLVRILNALEAGLAAVQKYGGAVPGDRTLVDALVPFLNSAKTIDASSPPESVKASLLESLARAEEGAEGTKGMTDAVLGRASYVPAEDLRGNADPGAIAACRWLRGVISAL